MSESVAIQLKTVRGRMKGKAPPYNIIVLINNFASRMNNFVRDVKRFLLNFSGPHENLLHH